MRKSFALALFAATSTPCAATEKALLDQLNGRTIEVEHVYRDWRAANPSGADTWRETLRFRIDGDRIHVETLNASRSDGYASNKHLNFVFRVDTEIDGATDPLNRDFFPTRDRSVSIFYRQAKLNAAVAGRGIRFQIVQQYRTSGSYNSENNDVTRFALTVADPRSCRFEDFASSHKYKDHDDGHSGTILERTISQSCRIL